MTQEVTTQTKTEYCYVHPSVETTLHCNRCMRPICAECAVLTPTGYRCKECVRSQQKIFDTSKPIDYPLAFIIALILGYLGSLIVAFIGFFTIFLAPVAGVVIAEAVRLVIGKRRSRSLFLTATVGALIGCVPMILRLVGTLFAGGLGMGFLFPMIWQALYIFMLPSTLYYRLSGTQLKWSR